MFQAGNAGLFSTFEFEMELLKTATKYSLIAIGSLTVIKGLVVFLKPKFQYIVGTSGLDSPTQTAVSATPEINLSKENSKELAMFHLRKPPDVWNTAFFFPDPDHDNPNVSDSSTRKLLDLLGSAKLSIKLCMYLSSYKRIENLIVKKFVQEGLIVQVVTCQETTDAHNNFQVVKYTKKGIPVRMKSNAGNLMHHKFVVIDDEAIITGSLNWTRQGIAGNRENVLVTTDPRIVLKYRMEFATLWNNCDDYNPRRSD